VIDLWAWRPWRRPSKGRQDDLEAEAAELRRQARLHSSEISALVERLNELQVEIRQHQDATPGRRLAWVEEPTG
jgi:hypothetical protein